MSARPVRHRTTVRVLPANGELTTHMRAAVRRILGEA